jgi:hypothetical protein
MRKRRCDGSETRGSTIKLKFGGISMRCQFLIYGFGAAFAAIAPAHGAPLTLTYDSYVETKVLSTQLDAATPIRMDGLLPDRGGSAVNMARLSRSSS